MIVVLFGPEASGKMTIGKELEKLANFNLLYNHQIIDLVGNVFNKENIGTLWNFKETHIGLIADLYEKFLKFAIDNNENLVFTITWNFNNEGMKNFFLDIQSYAKQKKVPILFVELFSTLEERLKRNNTPLRLENKVCKRDVKASNELLIACTKELRLNSSRENGEMDCFTNYLYVDNTYLQPNDVANSILKYIVENLI